MKQLRGGGIMKRFASLFVMLATLWVVLYVVQSSGNYTAAGSYDSISACEQAGATLHAPFFCRPQ